MEKVAKIFKKKKKKSPSKPEITVIPYNSELSGRHNPAIVLLLATVRVALLCAATASTGLLMTQLYLMPVSEHSIIINSLIFVTLFNILFTSLKYRFALPLIGIVSIFAVDFETLAAGAKCFKEILLVRLDSRLLYTIRYASITKEFLENPPADFIFNISYFIVVVSVVLGLIFTITSREKYIGFVFLTVLIVYIPAFGAEIATVVPALKWVVISVFGLYAIWAGGNFTEESSGRKKRKKSNLKIAGGISNLHRYSVNGVLAVLITIASISFANVVLPYNSVNFIEGIKSITGAIQEALYNIGEEIGFGLSSLFDYNGSIDDSGYFPSGNISSVSNSVDRISTSTPSSGTNPVLKVIFDVPNFSPVYLRSGIGVVYNAAGRTWDTPNSDAEIRELNKLLENYYPEHSYYIFRQRLNALDIDGNNYIGIQQITTEYLARTKNVFVPTVPYLSLYKNDKGYGWNIDTVLQSKNAFRKNDKLVWDMLYAKTEDSVRFSNLWKNVNFYTTLDTDYGEWNIDFGGEEENYIRVKTQSDYDSGYGNTNWENTSLHTMPDADYGERNIDFGIEEESYISVETQSDYDSGYGYINADTSVFGMSSAEYLEKTVQYEALVNSIYTRTDRGESENMRQLKNNVLEYAYTSMTDAMLSSHIEAMYEDNDVSSDRFIYAEIVVEYFKNNFTYSLTADNLSGDNSMLGNFLFETKSGHCALYASAMTLLMREAGHPARYVTGYVVSRRSASLNQDGRFEYTLLERNLHAWVEVYFEGLGWVSFDPTPPSPGNSNDQADTSESTEYTSGTSQITTTDNEVTTASNQTTSNTDGDTSVTGNGDKSDAASEPPYMMIIIITSVGLFVIIGMSAVLLFLKRLKKKEKALFERFDNAAARSVAAEMHTFIQSLLALCRIKQQAGELPTDFAARAMLLLPQGLDVDFTLVMDILLRVEFSKEELLQEEYQCISMFINSLYYRITVEKNPIKRLYYRVLLFN